MGVVLFYIICAFVIVQLWILIASTNNSTLIVLGTIAMIFLICGCFYCQRNWYYRQHVHNAVDLTLWRLELQPRQPPARTNGLTDVEVQM